MRRMSQKQSHRVINKEGRHLFLLQKKTLKNDKEVPKVWFIIIPILLKLWKVSLIEFELLLNNSLDSNWRQIVFLSKFLQSNTGAETRALCANHHGDCQAWEGPLTWRAWWLAADGNHDGTLLKRMYNRQVEPRCLRSHLLRSGWRRENASVHTAAQRSCTTLTWDGLLICKWNRGKQSRWLPVVNLKELTN